MIPPVDFDTELFDPPKLTHRPTKTKHGPDVQLLPKGVILDDRLLWVATDEMHRLGRGTLLIRNLNKSSGAGGELLPEHEHFDVQPRGIHAGRRGQSRVTVLDRVFHFPAIDRVGYASAQLAMWAMLRAPRDVEQPTRELAHRTANGMGKPRNQLRVHVQKMIRSADSVRDRLGRFNTRGRLVLKHKSIQDALLERQSDMHGIGVRMNARAALLAWAEDEIVRMLTNRGLYSAQQFLASPTMMDPRLGEIGIDACANKLAYEAERCTALQVQPYAKLARAMAMAFGNAAVARRQSNTTGLRQELELIVNYARIPAVRLASSIVTFQVAQARACGLDLNDDEWSDLYGMYHNDVVVPVSEMLRDSVNIDVVALSRYQMKSAEGALAAGDLEGSYDALTEAEDLIDGIMIDEQKPKSKKPRRR